MATLIFFLTLVTALRRAKRIRLAIHWSSERDTRTNPRTDSDANFDAKSRASGSHEVHTRQANSQGGFGFTFRC